MSRRTLRNAGACALALAAVFASERRSLAEAPAPTAAAAAMPAESPPTGRVMSLDECVALAMRNNPDARTSESELEGQKSERSGVAGAFAPKLHVDASVQQWNAPFNLPFALPGVSPVPIFAVRNAFTWTASVSLIQPITPLLAIYDEYKVEDLGVDIAAIQTAVARRDVAFRVAEAYFELLEATRLTEVAGASVKQLEAQERQAQSLLTNGVIGKNDLLRASLALASARQRLIQQKGNVTIARSRLASLMGMTPGSAIDAATFSGDPPSSPEPSMDSAEAHAIAQRLEVRALDRRIEQADKSKSFAKKKLLPQINLVGNYTHFDGSAFQQTDAAYVGLVGSWDVWDWGTTLSGVATADAKLHQAEIARSKLDDEIRLEARQAFVQTTTAREALDVARVGVAQAEENYRIVQKRFENATGTSFDLVDAEALLTQSRAEVENALYGYLIARFALQRATGTPLPSVRSAS
jgi:outer membrane protein TolC